MTAENAPGRHAAVSAPVAALLDVACVLALAMAGRSSHGGMNGLADVTRVAWPFLVALAAGWAASALWRRTCPVALDAGVLAWAVTLAGGMTVRWLAGGGVAVTFVLVAGSFLAVTMLGWRALVQRRHPAAAAS